jgi:nucleotide-binding universal stress UspA family protein
VKEILVPLDDSDLALRALPLAIAIAKAGDARLRLLRVIQPPVDVIPTYVPGIEEDAAAALAKLAASIMESTWIPVDTTVEFGLPASAIHAHVEPNTAAVVMSTHGRGGVFRVVMGSVAETVLRLAPVPVYLMPAGAEVPQPVELRRILVALDGSDLAYSVMAPVTELVAEFQASLILARVHYMPKRPIVTEDGARVIPVDEVTAWSRQEAETYLEATRARLAAQGIDVQVAVSGGDPAQRILAAATEHGAELIALATHGRSGMSRVTHGSVAEAVLRHSKVPVLTFGLAALRKLGRHAAGATSRESAVSL